MARAAFRVRETHIASFARGGITSAKGASDVASLCTRYREALPIARRAKEAAECLPIGSLKPSNRPPFSLLGPPGRRVALMTSAISTGGGVSSQQLTYLGQAEAQQVDEELMGPDLGFSIDQLMELAGLSVASAVQEVYGPSKGADGRQQGSNRILIICGPGNNGGDGLVAARHLHHFGFSVEVCYPKPTDKPLFNGLVKQCKTLGIPFAQADEIAGANSAPLADRYNLVMDAIFGFSFRGTPRPPFDRVLAKLTDAQDAIPIVSVDIPSGWDVEKGDVSGQGLKPDMLVSLTTPKSCAKSFAGKHHFLGGRFVPPAIVERFGLSLPSYPGASQCVRLD